MTSTIRFPRPVRTAYGPSEANQIITILPSTATLLKGGTASYVSVASWKTVNGDEAPYINIMLEFMADAAATIGDGATRIGLFGEIDPGGDLSLRRRQLLGILGTNLGQTAPQIPIIEQAGGDFVGWAQATCYAAAYDRLSIGGVEADIAVGANLIVTARPIRVRDFMG